MKKVKIIVLLVLLSNLLFLGVVFAASTSYTSSLLISSGSYHQGGYRDYTGAYHKISISFDAIFEPDLQNKIVVLLGKKKLFGGFEQKDRKVMNTILNSSGLWISDVNVGKTNVAYAFCTYVNCGTSTGGTGSYYSGLTSNNVVMTSRTSS